MKIIGTLVALTIMVQINSAIAQGRSYLCTDPKSSFTMNFLVHKKTKSIVHVSSLSPSTGQRFVLNENLNIVHFDDESAIAKEFSVNKTNVMFLVFNFSRLTLTTSNHVLDKKKSPRSSLYECVINQ